MADPTPAPGSFGAALQNLVPSGSGGSASGNPTIKVGGIPGADGLFPGIPMSNGVATPNDVLVAFAAMKDPTKIAALQHMLKLAGVYGTATPVYGSIRENDISAFKKIIEASGQQGADIGVFLKNTASAGQQQGIASAVAKINNGRSNQYTAPNPADVTQTFDDEYRKLVGHLPSPSERAGFLSAYQSFRRAEFDQANTAAGKADNNSLGFADPSAGVPNKPHQVPNDPTLVPGAMPQPDYSATGGGATSPASDNGLLSQGDVNAQIRSDVGPNAVTTSTSPEGALTFADNYIRNNNPGKTGAHDMAGQFQSFLGLLGGL